MGIENSLWVERYRPRSIGECIIPPRLETFFSGMVKAGRLQNMTLAGGAGTGKTTVARALCEQLGIDYIVINASEERNIDTIRTTVRDYGSSVSLTSDMKCIILDEADYLNAGSAQPALRGVIEELEGNCRFILTCNFPNRLIDPLLSRCPVVDFNFTKDEKESLAIGFLKRVRGILKENDVDFDQEQLFGVVVKNFPDFRKTLNLLQRYTVTGKLEFTNAVSNGEAAVKELIRFLVAKDFAKMRRWVVDHLENDGVALRRALYDSMFEYLEPHSIPEVVLILAEYDYKEGFCADKEVNAVAMLTQIMGGATFK